MKNKPPEVVLVNSLGDTIEGIHRFSHEAMATTFEILIQHEEYEYAREASLEAFIEIDRIEQELSRFVENSDISRLNAAKPGKPVQVGPETMECLKIACRLYEETNHAFDITVGRLFACLLDANKMPRMVSKDELKIALSKTGTNLLKLDEEWLTVQVAVEGVWVDPGGIGKGFALDKIGELLREWSIGRAMIHGGYSSVLALDAPEGLDGWPVTFSNPLDRREAIVRLVLENAAVSGSGVDYGMHIIDPRLAKPVAGKVAAWACAPDGATSDGLSTAFMVMSGEEIGDFCKGHPGVRGITAKKEKEVEFSFYGVWLDEERV